MTKPATAVQSMQFKLQGKILSSRRHESKVYTQIMTPAPDEYSHPSKFELRSNQSLGTAGDIFQGEVRVSGSLADRSYTDKKTGELKKITDKFIYLDVVE